MIYIGQNHLAMGGFGVLGGVVGSVYPWRLTATCLQAFLTELGLNGLEVFLGFVCTHLHIGTSCLTSWCLQSHPNNPFNLISTILVQTKPAGNHFLLILVLLQMPQPMTNLIASLARQFHLWGCLLTSVGFGVWANPSGIKLELDLRRKPVGIYYLRLQVGKKVISSKLLKQ